MSDRKVFIATLREVADFLESHPDCPVPESYGGISLKAELPTIEDVRKAFHLSGPWDKEYSGETALYRKYFGPKPENRWHRGSHVTYTISLPREQVCVKRQIGTRYVPPVQSYVPPATGYYEPVYEWDCM